MNTKILFWGLAFLVIFVFGFLVSRDGRPYSVLLLTIHKLSGFGVGVYLVVTAVQMNKQQSLSTWLLVTLAVTVVLFLGLIATGGALATEKEMPAFVIRVHKILPYLATAGTAVSMYMIL